MFAGIAININHGRFPGSAGGLLFMFYYEPLNLIDPVL